MWASCTPTTVFAETLAFLGAPFAPTAVPSMTEHVLITSTVGVPVMRGLAIGIALALILVLVPGGHFLLVLLIPLAFVALLMFRTTWQPVPTAYRPEARRPGPAEHR
jgi:hypothetical protein